MAVFPEAADIEYERSELTMPVYRNGELLEEVRLDALLKLVRSEPVELLTGHRQFEFRIDQWEVRGHSETLGADISLTLADVPQPNSTCIAAQTEEDFPAIIVYNAIFDVYVGNNRVLENQTGLGIGTGVTEIPPRGIDVAFQKAFTFGDLNFTAGKCSNMASLPESEFAALASDIVERRHAE